MKEILKLTLSLTLICAIAAAALAYVKKTTADSIADSINRQRTQKMLMVLPNEVTNTAPVNAQPIDGVTVYKATDANNQVVAFCAEGSDNGGFGGEVKVLVGMTTAGKILGVLVSEHSETPGIGTRVCSRETTKSLWSLFAAKSTANGVKLPPNAYLDGYTDQNLTAAFAFAEASAPGKIVPVSGATVSSKAVLNAVNRIIAVRNSNPQLFTTEAK